MSQFEFLMTFASVVLAIALTEIFSGWGKLARSPLPIRWSFLWVGWSLVLAHLIMMYWSGIWPYRDESFREGYKIAWLVIPTFLLVVLSFLFSPEPAPDPDVEEIDLEARYWQIAPRAFPVLALFMVAANVADVVISGKTLTRPDPHVAMLALVPTLFVLVVACGFVRAAWLHWLALTGFGVAACVFLFSTTGIFE